LAGVLDRPGKIICVGPKYAFEYTGDRVHMPAGSYLRLGQKYAEVFDKIRHRRVDWKPVAPTTATRVGDELHITFDVPTPPLVWDETISAPHQVSHSAWRNGRGFEVTANQVEIEIGDVAIQGNVVVVSLV
jgi:hypothetical protein